MRPNFVVLVKDRANRVISYHLYYSERKAMTAHRRFQSLSSDGSRSILLEDGRLEAVSPAADLRSQLRFIGKLLFTSRRPTRSSFFDANAEEFDELAELHGVPVQALREIASLERSYHENSTGARWDAIKRAYLPRLLGR